MGLATIDSYSQKEHTEIHKIPKFGVNWASFHRKIRTVFTWKSDKSGHLWRFVRICPHLHTFLFMLSNACISVKTSLKSV